MISVVVPLYNYADMIEENIRSIQKQTHQDWEIVIVDDGSTDDPIKVLKKYLCDNIRYIKIEKNTGYSAAKNVGIRDSKGKYIVVLDADDMLTPKSLSLRSKYLDDHPKRKWVIAKAFEFSGVSPPYVFKVINRKATRRLGRILKSKNYTDLWKSIHAQTVMVRRSVHEKIGLYEESLSSRADKEMWARIINNIGIPGYINEEVAYYRNHKRQMHRSKIKKMNLPKLEKRLLKLIKSRSKGNLKGVISL